MHLNFNALPNLIALAILVGVFAAISRHTLMDRLRLWLIGWILVLLRSLVQFLHGSPGNWARFDLALSLSALELGSIAFLVSVSPKADTGKRQVLLAAMLGAPALAYTSAMVWGVESRRFYAALVTVAAGMLLLLVWHWHRRITPYVLTVGGAIVACGGLLLLAIAVGKDDFGIHLILAALNFFAAGLYWYRFRRASAGVLVTVVGFIAWGAAYPGGLLWRSRFGSLGVNSEIWNIPKYLVALGMIVTLLEDQIRQSEYLAYHDALTGLPNRRLLEDRMTQALAHAARASRKVAVLLLDLDDFKKVNDSFGHRIGDAALQQVVHRLSSRMRASDTLARTGGDEFTVISEVASPQGAATLAEALRSALTVPLNVDGQSIGTGISIGFALYPDDATDSVQLCAAADRAMYSSKRGGRAPRSSAAKSTV